MARSTYTHSAYWYAYHCGWTHSDARTYAGKYLDIHTYRPRMAERPDGEFRSKDWFKWRNAEKRFDSNFNPLLLGVCIAADIGIAIRDEIRMLSDPVERDRMKRELLRDLRTIRRPFYYAREAERRRKLAEERRKVKRRRTTAPMPTPEELLAAWNERKASREAMIRLGGMLHDLECYVDNCLRFDGNGDVVGRNGGIRGWLKENLPELSPKYKTLMRYKALAVRLRQATDTKDPTPTSTLLDNPRHEVVAALLADAEPVFSHFFAELEFRISPDNLAQCLRIAPAKRMVERRELSRVPEVHHLRRLLARDGRFGAAAPGKPVAVLEHEARPPRARERLLHPVERLAQRLAADVPE